ncbi:hypothetical protein Syun_019427 [Stephania yunnanensis]|uniref:Uncharacterized protein n=1 Tax=Stephania yunnanensis TaxID=152371 RepID=A0AAP0NXZ8_9MAGN
MSTPGSMLQGIAKAVVQGAMEIMTAEPKSTSRDQTKETTTAEPKTVLRGGDQANEKEEEKKAKGMETKNDDTLHPISSSNILSLTKDKNDKTEKKKTSPKDGKKRGGRKIKKKNKNNDSSSSDSSSSSSSDSDDEPRDQQTMNNLFWIGIVGGVALAVLGLMSLPKIKSAIQHVRKLDGQDKMQAQKPSPKKENNDPLQIIIEDLLK